MEHETLKNYALDQSFLARKAEEFIHSKGMSEEFKLYFAIQKRLNYEAISKILELSKTDIYLTNQPL